MRRSHEQLQLIGPVVVGGVGGSGTRVLARILMESGFYLGANFNRALDSMWFTLLFVRRKWLSGNMSKRDAFTGFSILERASIGPFYPSLKQCLFVMNAVAGMAYSGIGYRRKSNGIWPIRKALSMFLSRRLDPSIHVGWGWKQPNSHIFLEYLADKFEHKLRYIHLLRNGLDMAFSSNQTQLFNWGPSFDVSIPDSRELIPRASLEYWIKANERVVALGKRIGDAGFLCIKLEDLCASPYEEMAKIFKFLDLDMSRIDINELRRVIKTPDSIGRYRNHDCSMFDQESLDRVEQLGYSVEV